MDNTLKIKMGNQLDIKLINKLGSNLNNKLVNKVCIYIQYNCLFQYIYTIYIDISKNYQLSNKNYFKILKRKFTSKTYK